MGAPWRLLITLPAEGAWNMAVDEALFLARLRGEAPPTIRFYAWHPPTLSLGYGQRLEEGIDLEFCRASGVGLVRRLTGGSAVLHDREVTYSVVARASDFLGAEGPLETYRAIGQGLVEGLRRLGVPAELVPPPRGESLTPQASVGDALLADGKPQVAGRERQPVFCFSRIGSYEIAVSGKKLVGSAQRRRRGGLLQHGSILLDLDLSLHRRIFPAGPEDPFSHLTTLGVILGRPVAFGEVVPSLARGMAASLGVTLEPGGLTALELEQARRLTVERYGSEAWIPHLMTPLPVGRKG